jgi:hypothetical protein
MADVCCKLVGSLKLTGLEDACITSVSSSSKAEIIKECGEQILVGPTTGTVSITGYAVDPSGPNNGLHVGCPGRTGVTIPWVKRYDCDLNVVHMIPGGKGSSYIAGETQGLAEMGIPLGRSFPSMSASSNSGPATVYMETSQEDGYGLKWTGGPISFDTSDVLIIENFGVGSGPLYLQSFSAEFNPGEIPTATYSFTFIIVD